MPQLRVLLFGRFRVLTDHDISQQFEGRKVQELFSYLLLYHNQSHHRESLATLLWCDSPPQKSRKYLRKAIWQLQNALAACQPEILLVEPEWVSLNTEADVWTDVLAFEASFAQVRNISGYHLTPPQAQLLQEAIQLYQGDLLDGWFEDWCLCERTRLQHVYLTSLDKIMRYCEAQANYESGVDYGYHILRYDNAREHTHRQLMRLRFLCGDRTGALRQYEACATALAEELDVEPSPKTKALYQQICHGRLTPNHPAPAPSASPPTPSSQASLCQLLEHIDHIQQTLQMMSQQIQQEIPSFDS